MSAARQNDNKDIPAEIDFSGGTRGKFHRPNAKLNLPVYLEAAVQDYLAALAARKGVPLSDLANELLKRDIAILETGEVGGLRPTRNLARCLPDHLQREDHRIPVQPARKERGVVKPLHKARVSRAASRPVDEQRRPRRDLALAPEGAPA